MLYYNQKVPSPRKNTGIQDDGAFLSSKGGVSDIPSLKGPELRRYVNSSQAGRIKQRSNWYLYIPALYTKALIVILRKTVPFGLTKNLIATLRILINEILRFEYVLY